MAASGTPLKVAELATRQIFQHGVGVGDRDGVVLLGRPIDIECGHQGVGDAAGRDPARGDQALGDGNPCRSRRGRARGIGLAWRTSSSREAEFALLAGHFRDQLAAALTPADARASA